MFSTAYNPPHLRPAVALTVLLSAGACAPRNAVEDPPPAGPSPASIEVGAATAAPGERVSVVASGFDPESTVQVGFGQPQSEYSVVDEIRADAEGGVNTMLTVPDWAMRGQPYVVVVTDPDHDPRVVSDPLIVGAAGDTVRVTGTLEQGVECPAVRAPTGALFTLATRDLQLSPGRDVHVIGTIAEVSFCMQGTTLNIVSIEGR